MPERILTSYVLASSPSEVLSPDLALGSAWQTWKLIADLAELIPESFFLSRLLFPVIIQHQHRLADVRFSSILDRRNRGFVQCDLAPIYLEGVF